MATAVIRTSSRKIKTTARTRRPSTPDVWASTTTRKARAIAAVRTNRVSTSPRNLPRRNCQRSMGLASRV